MGGFFGAVCRRDCVTDVFFGTDYHSHLGTRRGGMAAFSQEEGFQRYIHNIENSPFRTKFEDDVLRMKGRACIGSISDTDPQPILIKSHHGVYAISTVGIVNNAAELTGELISQGGHFGAMGGGRINATELAAALIDRKSTFAEGIRYAQEKIQGSLSLLILTEQGEIIAARDLAGRTPILVGQSDDGCCASFESFAYQKLGYRSAYELGPGEVVRLTAEGWQTLVERESKMRICAFLWTYYGYPTSCYEGVSVERMRNRNGEIIADTDKQSGKARGIDYACGVPDSGVAHAIGYSNRSGVPYARPFIKYTPTWPRSFMPTAQIVRNQVAKMKLIPVHELIEGKKLLFVDDSIVRGTQLRETVEFLYDNGADQVHMRSACPPIMYGCKYLNFSRSTSEMELIARQTVRELEGESGEKHLEEYADASTARGRQMREEIGCRLKLTSLEYQSLEGLTKAIGIPRCNICTYCWNGKE